MKLERLIGILMILLNDRHVTAKSLSQRFSVSLRTIQRDINILSLAGIPVTASTGPGGGYGLLEEYTLNKNYFRKEEMQLLTDLLGGLGNLLSQAGFANIRDKINTIRSKDSLFEEGAIRFDFLPWLPQHDIQDKLTRLSGAISGRMRIEMEYRDQKGRSTHRRIEPHKLVMKGYAWYLYGYCLLKNDFRYFKVIRIMNLRIEEESFEPRPLPATDPFLDFPDNLTDICLKFSLKAIGRIEDYFTDKDIRYEEDYILVNTRYPDDEWLYQTLLSFGKEVEVLEPPHIREKLQKEAMEILGIYAHGQ